MNYQQKWGIGEERLGIPEWKVMNNRIGHVIEDENTVVEVRRTNTINVVLSSR